MNKTGKVMGIIAVILIAFFSASLISAVHAGGYNITFAAVPANGGTISPLGTGTYDGSTINSHCNRKSRLALCEHEQYRC